MDADPMQGPRIVSEPARPFARHEIEAIATSVVVQIAY
jgi:hypothetical protein